MPLTITVTDLLAKELQSEADLRMISVEQFALDVLGQAVQRHELAEAVEGSASVTPREAVLTIQATAPNPSQVRPATADLAEVLRASPGDLCFDLESWNRQWSVVEAELKAITRANSRPCRV